MSVSASLPPAPAPLPADSASQTALDIPESLCWAHPLIQEWFVRKFGTPTEPQIAGWPHILARRTTLISAPTGSGKTLAAFLACIDDLVRKALSGALREQTEVVYISPLKALGNDIQKNLEAPLSEILALGLERGYLMPRIRTGVRTGDTPPAERIRMLKLPPHILVTTPESLYILLTAEKSRNNLRRVHTVIVDEIHAIADDKRGSHLSLSLERLDALVQNECGQVAYGQEPNGRRIDGSPPLRIGLSATQKPIELVGKFLTGENPRHQDPAIVDVGQRRTFDLAIETPGDELGSVTTNSMWAEIYDRLAELARQHRSTLIFVNTRALAERLAHHLGERLGEGAVAAHHGSLSRKLRLEAEQKLKQGKIKALVATASLELGIDIGFVDLVCLIGTPRAIAAALQRIGRAGHWRGATPKGRLFASTRDDLIECAALVRSIRRGELDKLEIPPAPIDVLAQQIVAACGADEWHEDDLFDLARRAYPYRDLSRDEYEEVLAMLTEGFAAQRGRYGAHLHWDRVNRRLKARRGSRMIAVTNGGAIPDTALYTVIVEPEGIPIATLDEDFAIDSSAGDVILLGNTSWRVLRIESAGRVLVEDAHGAAPTVPFWRGEAPQRTQELSLQVAELRQTISDLTQDVTPECVSPEIPQVAEAVAWLKAECGVNDSAAEQMVEYIAAGRAVLGAVPTQQTIIAERFFDEGGGMQLILHAPFGGRINKAWGLALRKRFCVSFNFELQATATDNGLNISLAEQHSFPLADVFRFLHEDSVQKVLQQASFTSPIFGTRWRWDAARSLALQRFRNGKKVPPQIQRTRSDDLLASVFPQVAACQENIKGDIEIPDHPLVREVMKDVLTEAMDVEGLKQVLRGIAAGSIRCLAVDTPVPSQFSHELLNANPYAFLDDAPIEERRARAVQMRRGIPDSVLQEVGGLDPAAIDAVREQAWPDLRDADELHDLLQTLVALPEEIGLAGRPLPPVWHLYFEKLRAARRATCASVDGRSFWICAEKFPAVQAIYPQAGFADALPELGLAIPTHDDALLALVTGWMMYLGPATAIHVSEFLSLPASEVLQALLRLEASGCVLRGSFEARTVKPDNAALDRVDLERQEFCDRRLLARIHRLTLNTLRKQVEPVTAAVFMQWLLRWQHVAPQTQVAGEAGVHEVLRQMQGFEIPASCWERHTLALRVSGYDPRYLDQLCLAGAVGWGRISPHPATLEDSEAGARRIVPTSVAPITFFLRDRCEWMSIVRQDSEIPEPSELCISPEALKLYSILRERGACFFAELTQWMKSRDSELPAHEAGQDRPKQSAAQLRAEVESALWELAAAGVVTADSFENLRALIDPRRKAAATSHRISVISRSHIHNSPGGPGRWSLLFPVHGAFDRATAIESACHMLLQRYGVVFRDLLARESLPAKWRELLVALRRMEARSEVRGGRFVSGFGGEQFALPEALESLREYRKHPSEGEEVTVPAADPLNLVGILVPGERVPAVPGRFVTFRDGVAVAEEQSASASGP